MSTEWTDYMIVRHIRRPSFQGWKIG